MSQPRPSSVSRIERPIQVKNQPFSNLSYNENRRNILNYNVGPKVAPVFAQTVFPDSNIYIKTRPFPNKFKNVEENIQKESSQHQKPNFYYNNERPASSHVINPEKSRYDHLVISNKKSPTNRLNLSKPNVFEHFGQNRKANNEMNQPKIDDQPQKENGNKNPIGKEFLDKENAMSIQNEKNINKNKLSETLKSSSIMKENDNNNTRDVRRSCNLTASHNMQNFKSTYNINKILKNSASVLDNLKFKASTGISSAISARDFQRSPKKSTQNVSNNILHGNI